MHRTVTAFAILCTILATTAHACLWDRDTLAAEAKGLPGITEIITGRFDRFPPLFYEMRLERVTKELASDPDSLALFDDAGVACDRLGRSDEAIGWMERKRETMERLEAGGGDVGEHRYRYLANLGTFHIHRWLNAGADRGDMGDVERSRELIAAAIELNPDAHFGRERYQLLAIEWILNQDVLLNGKADSIFSQVPGYTANRPSYGRNELASLGYSDAIEGLSGLISLGSAWQSVDIYYALAWALAERGDNLLAHLCMVRVNELVEQGHQSLSINFREYVNLEYGPGSDHVRDEARNTISTDYYTMARKEASHWIELRNAYLSDRLNQGSHPDTNPDFWNAWTETSSPPDMPGRVNLMLVIPVGFVVLILIGFLIYRVVLHRFTKPI